MDWIFLVGANVGQFCDVTLRMTISAFSLNRPRNSCLHKIERRKIMMKFMKRGRKQIMKLILESFVDMLFRRCSTRDAFSSNNFKTCFLCIYEENKLKDMVKNRIHLDIEKDQHPI